MAGLIGDFPLDDLNGGKVSNRIDPRSPARRPRTQNRRGRIGKGASIERREQRHAPTGQFRSLPAILALPLDQDARFQGLRGDHSSLDGLDRRRQPGLSAPIEDGKLSAGLIHFWPGNAIGIRAAEPSRQSMDSVTITYDGSSRASGLALYVDGQRASCEIIRDHLTKNITGGGNDQLTVGQRFRDRGFKNGLVDEIKVFDRELTPLEVAHLHDGDTLAKLLSLDPAKLTSAMGAPSFCLLPGHG